MITGQDSKSADSEHEATLRIVTEGAHEVRSQLAVMLLEAGKIDHPQSVRIEAGLRTASDTVNRIAMLFKLATTGNMIGRVFNSNEIVSAVVKRAEPDFPARLHRIDIRSHDESAIFLGNAAFVSEAICGLIDNALRHTPDETRIIVRSTIDGCIEIDDDGPGLPASVVERFGQPFVHGRVPTAGPGLGFAIAHQVARLHNGRCFLAPSQLGGACVCISFNANADRAKTHG
jgi:two-component system, OmpR family, sensor histidine kinase QseC